MAGKIFVLAVILLLGIAPVILARVWWGSWSPWSCAGFLFVYSRVLLWGFLNYLVGVGLALLVLAGWSALDRAGPLRRGLFGAVAGFVVFLCHLEAFGVLAILLLGAEVPKLWRATMAQRAGRALGLALALLPATLVFLLHWRPNAAGAVALPRFDRKLDLLFSVFDDYSRPFDVGCFVGLVTVVGYCLWRGRLQLITTAAWPLGLLSVAYLVLPSTLFTGAGADHRLPVVIFLILSAAVRPAPTTDALRILAHAGLVLMLLRLGVVTDVWWRAGSSYSQDLHILDALPPGARLAVAAPAGDVAVTAAPVYHLPVLAVATRQAFVPTLFAYASQQPVALRPPWNQIAAGSDPGAVWSAFLDAGPSGEAMRQFVTAHYDFIIFAGRPVQHVAGCVATIAGSGRFVVARIVPGSPCRPSSTN